MNSNPKTVYTIVCLLILFLNQQVVSAQQEAKKEPVEDFVKLEMPLEEAFTQITFLIPNLKSGDLDDAVVFQGEGVTHHPNRIVLTRKFELEGSSHTYHESYTLLTEHAAEGKRYIFVPFAYWGGGSGVFWNLNVVDKKTLRTVAAAGIRDRAAIREIILANSDWDTVTITYLEREVKGPEENCQGTHTLKRGACAS